MVKMMKEMKIGVFEYNNESYEFAFKTSLSVYDKSVFVKTVVNNIVDANGFDCVIRDLVFDFVIVDMFTNVDTSFIDMKDDNDEIINPIIVIEHFLENSNIVDIVKANMEVGLLDDLNRAIDLNVQYLTGIRLNSVEESFAGLLSTIEDKINDIDLNSVIDMTQKFSGMTEDFTIENLIKAYMNSEFHNKNLVEIAEAKK